MCYGVPPMRPAPLVATLLLALASGIGCVKADFIEITPDVVTLKQKNNMVWLRAMVKSHNGQEYPQARPSWSVRDPSIAQVDEAGKLTPVKSGRTEVVASYGDISASIPVEVLYAEKMKVTPANATLDPDGEPVEFSVQVFDYMGRELRDRTPSFKSLDQKVLTMGQNAAHPGQPGSTKVEVRVDELIQFVDVSVGKGRRK